MGFVRSRRGRRAVGLALALLSACAGKAPPAPPAGFADAADMTHNPALPFHRVWRDRAFDFTACDSICIAAVDTDYLLSQTWWQEVGRGSKAHADAVELGREFRDCVVAAFRDDPLHRFAVVDEGVLEARRQRTLVLELAIVELVPNRAVLQVLTLPAGPMGLLARKGMDALERTSIAFEGRVRDAASGAIVATVADREQKKSGLINVKNFTWYGHVREILAEWADQFRLVANKAPDEVVPDSPAWDLLPW
ncbi:MAG: DUF3313 family protein [Planctomycetes bacterium]|nr:DUF3313 family protein [Planctomycetota bacterium]